MSVEELIKTAKIKEDCGGKFDLDFMILEAGSRGYPPKYNENGKWSMYVGFYGCGTEILNTELFGDSKEEVVLKARQWYIDNLFNAMITLRDWEKENGK